MTCAAQIEDVPGIVSLTTFARTHTAVIEYDPTQTDVETIKEEICADIVDEGKTHKDIFTID